MATSISGDSKPTILIVPGGWHSASVYSHFAAELESLGYPTTTTSLPSVNSKSPQTATCTEDSNALRKELLSLIETDEKDVVILAHSYGGLPAGGAAHGLSKTNDKKGGVVGLIYMSAFVVPEGTSLLDYLGGKHAPYLVADQVSTRCPVQLSSQIPIPQSSLFILDPISQPSPFTSDPIHQPSLFISNPIHQPSLTVCMFPTAVRRPQHRVSGQTDFLPRRRFGHRGPSSLFPPSPCHARV